MPRGWGRVATKERGWRERASASVDRFYYKFNGSIYNIILWRKLLILSDL